MFDRNPDKLILAVVQQDELEGLIRALHRDGLSCTIRSSTGGFLKKKNTTLLIGLPHERLSDALGLIRIHAHARAEQESPPLSDEMGAFGSPLPAAPEGARRGGAAVFVLDLNGRRTL